MTTTTRRLGGIALLVAAAACSRPAQVQLRDGGPGSRLAAVVLIGPDGLRAFDGFHDTALGQDCVFEHAADGALRCLPFTSARSTAKSTLYNLGCGVEPVCIDLLSSTDRYAWVAEPGTCPTRWRVYELGAWAQMRTNVLYRPSPGAPCALVPSYSVQCVARGDELPPSTFVEAVEQAGPAGAGVAVRQVVAADGAWSRGGLTDLVGGAHCRPGLDGAGTLRCLPDAEAVVGADYCAGGSCTAPAVRQMASEGDCLPTLAIASATSACRSLRRVFAVGDPTVDVSIDFGGSPDQCVAVYGPFVLDAYWTVGGELPTARYPVVAERVESGGRLRPVDYDLGGALVSSGRWEDTALGIRCQFQYTHDGAARCLPLDEAVAEPVVQLFGDEGCTEPLALAEGCAPAYARTWDGSYFEVGGSYSGPVYAWESIGSCKPVTWTPPGQAYFLGAPVPDATFAEFTWETWTR